MKQLIAATLIILTIINQHSIEWSKSIPHEKVVYTQLQTVTPIALHPKSNPWSGSAIYEDSGSCGMILDGYGFGSLSWPTDSHEIKPGRGYRFGHGAIDILSDIGSSVYASSNGVVIWAGYSRWGGGNVVVLAHGNTWQTHYYHLTDIFVDCGDYVPQGTQIATSGQTGASSFPHLHFELRYNGLEYDPLNYLP